MKANGLRKFVKAHKLSCDSLNSNSDLRIEVLCTCGLEQALKELDVLLNLAGVGLEMRRSQVAYFTRGRNYKDLEASKRREGDFDKLLLRLISLGDDADKSTQKVLL